MADVWLAYGFGVAGYLMKRHGWPRIALVMALVLGPLFENNLRLTIALHSLGRTVFWTRPTVLLLLLLIVLTLASVRAPAPRRGPAA
jgi:putative tricarboxylic transport membrane protein